MSLGAALEILGFAPWYHMITILNGKRAGDYEVWNALGEGTAKPEDLDRILAGQKSVLDYPASLYPKELYEAYPNAKFVLTVRDVEKWIASMKATLVAVNDSIEAMDASKVPREMAATHYWWKMYGPVGTKRGSADLHTAFNRHNDYVKALIPAEQLLVYEVGEGWERLCKFLSVPVPDVPFPHVNDKEEFQQKLASRIELH